MNPKLSEPYRPRPIRFLGLWDTPGFQLKAYGIAHGRALPRSALVRAARDLAETRLAGVAAGQNHYGVGFVGIHDGRGGNFVFVDWWADENELHHHVWISPHDRPAGLEEVTSTGLSACVWDLAVICHERAAWLECVLANPGGPNLPAYLSKRLEADV
ncbi:MAG: isochorismatase [Gammaproteobacteria bacterium]|nr:isochorismatase [Gammaproteobacteria bacterium]